MYFTCPSTRSRTVGARFDSRRRLSLVTDAFEVSAAVDAVYRSDWGRIVATLIRFVRDFDLAEEAAQEAFAAAVDQWRVGGVPEWPGPGSSRPPRTRPSTPSVRKPASAESRNTNAGAGPACTG